jgi:multicomponent Na+:H+ antiporter subunit C
MELPLALVIGLMFAAGTYLILRPNLIRIVLGFGLYSNAVNLLLIYYGGYPSATAEGPFFAGGDIAKMTLMDPLPPDIILTAIVISFAVGALFLTICYRVYRDYGIDNPEHLPADPYAGPPAPVATLEADGRA